MKKLSLLILFLWSFLCSFAAETFTVFCKNPDYFPVIADGIPCTILSAESENKGIRIAVANLQDDFGRVSGKKPAVLDAPGSSRQYIIIGSMESPLIRHLFKTKKLDAKELEGKKAAVFKAIGVGGENIKIGLGSYVECTLPIFEGLKDAYPKAEIIKCNDIMVSLRKIKSVNRVRIFEPEKNYNNWGLDFQSFESMGTKLLFYRHDLFNAWGFSGRAFCLDPEYLDKWVFQNWERNEYDLKKLFISNSNAVTMQEFSCWTLGFPDAHARITIPEYVEKPLPEAA